MCFSLTVGASCAYHTPVCRTCYTKTTGGACGAPCTRASHSTYASYDSCSSHQRGPYAAISASHYGPQTTSHGCSSR